MDDPKRRGAVANWIRTVGDPWLATEHPPAAGSSLAGDDRLRPPVSELARFGIATGIDHLGLVVDVMGTEQPFRHHGPLTVLRTTLLVAGRTLWLLSASPRAERQHRACRIEFQNLTEQRKAIDAIKGDQMSPELVEGRRLALIANDRQRDELRTKAEALKPGVNLCKPDDTASILDKLVDQHTDVGQAIRHLWRTGSAAAHGFHWSNLRGEEFDEASFNTSLYGSMMLLSDALNLYIRQATSHL